MTAPTLTEFLLARLSEDEAVAQTCAEMFPPPWEIADRGWRVRVYAADVATPDFSSDDEDAMTTRAPVVMEVEPDRHIEDPHWLSERVAHIARHNPARVLAQVKAMRAIVEAFPQGPESIDVWDEAGWVILTALATPFADHPDYDPAWRLDA